MSQISAMEYLVHDRAEFDAAVTALLDTGGEIRIATGVEPFRIHIRNLDAAATIAISSEDPDTPSHVTMGYVGDSSNFSISNLYFDPIPTDGIHSRPTYGLEVIRSSNVTLTGNTFAGGATGTLGLDTMEEASRGVMVRLSDGVSLSDNSFTGNLHALTLMSATNVDVLDNGFTGLQADAIQVAGAQNLTIQGNVMQNMYGSANDIWHADMIQVWGASIDTATENLVIRDNYMDGGDASYQGIFTTNKSRDTLPFSGLVVENNTVVTGSPNGIYINSFADVAVRNNTVIYNPDAEYRNSDGTLMSTSEPRILLQDVQNGVVEDNIGAYQTRTQADMPNTNVVWGTNTTPDYLDPESPAYIDKIFVNAGNGGETDPRDFQQLADSPLAGMGSDMADRLAAQLIDDGVAIRGMRIAEPGTQEAHYSVHEPVDGVSYRWVFSDGRVVDGPEATRVWPGTGTQDVRLEARVDGALVDTMTRSHVVDSAELLDLDFDADPANWPILERFDAAHVQTVTDGPDGGPAAVYVMTGDNPFDISRSHEFFNALDAFSMSIDLRRTDPGTPGEIIALPSGIEITLNADGTLRLLAETSQTGRIVQNVGENLLQDTDWHRLSVSYSSAEGQFELRIDDVQIVEWEMTGNLNFRNLSMQVGSRFGLDGMPAEIAGIRIVDYATETDAEIDGTAALLAARAGPLAVGFDTLFEGSDAFWISTDFESPGETRGAIALTLDDAGRNVTFADGSSGQGLELAGGSHEGYEIARGTEGIHGLDEFTLAFNVAVDAQSATGDLVYLPNAFRLRYVDGSGLEMQLDTGATPEDHDRSGGIANSHMFETAALEDGAFHRVVASYDGDAGQLTLYVDGTAIGSAAVAGFTAEHTYWGMSIGSKWQGSASAVLDDFTFANRAVTADQVQGDHADFIADTLGDGSAAAAPEAPAEPGGVHIAEVFDSGDNFWVRTNFEGIDDVQGSIELAFDDAGRNVTFTDGSSGQGLDLAGGSHEGLEVARGVEGIHALDEFTLAFNVAVDEDSATGDLVHLPNAFRLRYVEGSGLEMQLDTGATPEDHDRSGGIANSHMFETAALEDGAFHRVVASYDGDAGQLTLYVDGTAIGSAEVAGFTAAHTYWGMSIGSKWQGSASAVLDDFSFANLAVSEDHVVSDHMSFEEIMKATPDQLADAANLLENDGDGSATATTLYDEDSVSTSAT